MAKLIKLTFLFSINLFLIQHSYCKRIKRAIPDFLIPGINLGDIALEALQNYIYGTPPDKDQMILDKQLEHMAMTREILSVTRDIAAMSADVPEMTVLIQTLQSVPKFFNSIDEAFRQYEVFKYSKRNSSDYQVRQFVTYSNNRYIGPLKEVINLYSVTIPSLVEQRSNEGDYSLLSLMARQMKGYKKMCDKFKSQRQMMQIILEGITIAELKTFLVMEFALRMLAETEQINYQGEVDQLKRELLKRFEKLEGTFKVYIADASPEVWRCDPKDGYVEGKTYFKLNNLFQLYFARDKDLNGAVDCHYTCGHFAEAKETSCRDENIGYYDIDVPYVEYTACKTIPKCQGTLYGCSDRFAAHSELWVCPADQKENSTRRYDFIRHGNINKVFNTRSLTVYGPYKDQGGCKKEYTYNYRAWDVNFRVCETCSCVCDDSVASYSDKRVNLRAATADKDYVVTGVRWVKQDHILHLQIEQGKLLARGKVEPSTIHWKPIQEAQRRTVVDFHWLHLRGFLLRDTKVPEGKVVAGVKFEYLYESNIKLLSLRLLSVPFEYESGKLQYPSPFYNDPDRSVDDEDLWKPVEIQKHFSNDEELYFGAALLPTNVKKPSLPIENSKKFVRLTTSNFESDLGQSTVPFFDMQQNTLSTPLPLSGIGIYLKKSGDSVGFLALKLLTFDNTRHLTEKI